VDASVVAKWVLPDEEYIEKALKVKQDHISGKISLSAPTILPLEIANAIWKAVKLTRFSQADAQQALKLLQDISIDLYSLNWVEVSEVLDVANRFDVAVYDVAYIFLSEKLKAPFISSDTKLVEKVKSHFQIIPLNEYV
jgi:predicted nucleic acid-binding protein